MIGNLALTARSMGRHHRRARQPIDAKVAALHVVPGVCDAPPAELAQLPQWLDQAAVDGGRVLLRPGMLVRQILIVTAGTVAVQGFSDRLSLVGPGLALGAGTLDRGVRTAHRATAIEATSLLVISVRAWQSLTLDAPVVAALIRACSTD